MKLRLLGGPKKGEDVVIGDDIHVWKTGDLTVGEERVYSQLTSELKGIEDLSIELISKIVVAEGISFDEARQVISLVDDSVENPDESLKKLKDKYLLEIIQANTKMTKNMPELNFAAAYAIKNRLAISVEKYLETGPNITKQLKQTYEDYIKQIRNLTIEQAKELFTLKDLATLANFYRQESGTLFDNTEGETEAPDLDDIAGKSTVDVTSTKTPGKKEDGERSTTGQQSKSLPAKTMKNAQENSF